MSTVGSMARKSREERWPEKEGSVSQKPIDPLFNAAFIRIFGQPDSKNLTRGLVNAILSKAGLESIDEIKTIEAEHTSVLGSVKCKTPRMDVRIVSENKLVDLEAQTYPDDIEKRSLFYGSQLLAGSLDRGQDYSDMPQAVVITLLDDRPRFPDAKGFISVSSMYWHNEPDGYLGESSDRLVFVLVELGKIRARYNGLEPSVLKDEAVAWAYLLTSGYSNAQEVQSIMEQFPSMEEFAERYGFAIDDPKVKRAYEDALSAEREYNSRQRYYARLEREAREKGFAQGIEEGIEEGRAQGIEQGIEEGRAQGIEQGIE